MKPMRHREQQVRLRSDCDLLPTEMEVPVQHCIDQLAALAAILFWNGYAADLRQESHQFIIGRQSGQSGE